MANTIEFALSDTAWTDISTTTGASGFLTNGGAATVYFTQSETAPAITITSFHRLDPTDRVNYSVTGSEVVYARSKQTVGKLAATGGVLS